MALHNIADKWILDDCYLVFECMSNNRISMIYVLQKLTGLKIDVDTVYKPLKYTSLNGLYQLHKIISDNDLYFNENGEVYKEVIKFSVDDFLKCLLNVKYEDCPEYYDYTILTLTLDIQYGSVTNAVNKFFEEYHGSLNYTFSNLEFLDNTFRTIPCVLDYGNL